MAEQQAEIDLLFEDAARLAVRTLRELATERLSLLPDGRVTHQLRRPWRDGTPSFQ